MSYIIPIKDSIFGEVVYTPEEIEQERIDKTKDGYARVARRRWAYKYFRNYALDKAPYNVLYYIALKARD